MTPLLLFFCFFSEVFSSSFTNPTISPTQPAQVDNYGFVGCYQDDRFSRILTDTGALPIPSNDDCASTCAAFVYFGTEFGQECKSILTLWSYL